MIGGVQGSLNQIFNLVKFLLVIAMPDPNMFGFLILASFTFYFICHVILRQEV